MDDPSFSWIFQIFAVLVGPKSWVHLLHIVKRLSHSHVVQFTKHVSRRDRAHVARTSAIRSPVALWADIVLCPEASYFPGLLNGDHGHHRPGIVSENEAVNLDIKQIIRNIPLHHANLPVSFLRDSHFGVRSKHLPQ